MLGHNHTDLPCAAMGGFENLLQQILEHQKAQLEVHREHLAAFQAFAGHRPQEVKRALVDDLARSTGTRLPRSTGAQLSSSRCDSDADSACREFEDLPAGVPPDAKVARSALMDKVDDAPEDSASELFPLDLREVHREHLAAFQVLAGHRPQEGQRALVDDLPRSAGTRLPRSTGAQLSSSRRDSDADSACRGFEDPSAGMPPDAKVARNALMDKVDDAPENSASELFPLDLSDAPLPGQAVSEFFDIDDHDYPRERYLSESTVVCASAPYAYADVVPHRTNRMVEMLMSPVMSQSSDIMENLNLRNSIKALASAVWDSNVRSHSEVQDTLQYVPRTARHLMYFLGTMPCTAQGLGEASRGYRFYTTVLQYALWTTAMLWSAQWAVGAYFSGSFGQCVFPAFLGCGQAATLPYMMLWRTEFAPGGQALALLCNLAEADVDWAELRASTGMYFLLVLTLSFATICVRFEHVWRNADMEAFPRESTLLDALGIPATCWWIASIYGYGWLSMFDGKLHRFDLLKYARAVAEALESEVEADDLLDMLKKYEATVTKRLRCASRTWVRYGLILIALNALAGMNVCLFLLENGYAHVFSGAVMLFGILTWNSVVCCSITLVAETFDYDVIRFLNNPVVLSRVQKYMGQQFLSHLLALDWGFRYGATVLSTKLSMQISVPLVITFISTVGKVIFNNLAM